VADQALRGVQQHLVDHLADGEDGQVGRHRRVQQMGRPCRVLDRRAGPVAVVRRDAHGNREAGQRLPLGQLTQAPGMH
jgi:hypothetical protein